MKSPFPGMDPYLEDHLWPDVHNRLAAVISELLAPQIAPNYERSLHHLSIDYQKNPPPPDFNPEMQEWIHEVIYNTEKSKTL